MKQRNHAFDLLCGLCIVRMISLHVIQQCGRHHEEWWLTVMSWSFFFMCFFFFKAGYFNKSLAGDSRKYVLDKTKRLLVPWLTAGLIGNAIYFAFYPFICHRYGHWVEPLPVENLWRNSGFQGNGPTWFLFSFYWAYIIVHFIEKVPHLHWIILLFPALSWWLYTEDNPAWLELNNVPIGIFFFMLGRLWHRAMDHMGPRRTILVSSALVLYFVVANTVWHGEYTMSSNEFTGPALAAVLNTMAVLCGLSGLLIAARVPRVPWISYVGEHSMVYFISHMPIIYFYRWTHLSFGRSIYGHYDDVIILIPSIFMICSWLVPYIEGIPWLSGRWKKAS